MYSPDKQGEYILLDGAPRFSLQGLSDALADVGEGITEPPAGMVMHILKNGPVLRELEHVQVDGPRTAYLFFYDK